MLKVGCYLFANQLISPMPDVIIEELLQHEWKHCITGSAEDFLQTVYEDVRTQLQRREESKAMIEGEIYTHPMFSN